MFMDHYTDISRHDRKFYFLRLGSGVSDHVINKTGRRMRLLKCSWIITFNNEKRIGINQYLGLILTNLADPTFHCAWNQIF
jgi:hypothetical protein